MTGAPAKSPAARPDQVFHIANASDGATRKRANATEQIEALVVRGTHFLRRVSFAQSDGHLRVGE